LLLASGKRPFSHPKPDGSGKKSSTQRDRVSPYSGGDGTSQNQEHLFPTKGGKKKFMRRKKKKAKITGVKNLLKWTKNSLSWRLSRNITKDKKKCTRPRTSQPVRSDREEGEEKIVFEEPQHLTGGLKGNTFSVDVEIHHKRKKNKT